MNVCAKYGRIVPLLGMYRAITLVIWVERQDKSYMMVFLEHFIFLKCHVTQSDFLHKLPIFLICLSNFLRLVSKWGQHCQHGHLWPKYHTLVDQFWVTFGIGWNSENTINIYKAIKVFTSSSSPFYEVYFVRKLWWCHFGLYIFVLA